MVVLQHSDNPIVAPEWVSTFFSHVSFSYGVDIFFVISGYLVSRSLFSIIEEAKLSGCGRKRVLWAFLLRRAFRLLPSAWLWLAIGVLIFIAVEGFPRGLALNISATTANVANGYWLLCHHHELECPPRDIDAVYWSLSLEEQFYLLLALAVLLVGKSRLIIPAVLLIALQFGLRRHSFDFLWLFRTDALLWGFVLFAISEQPWFQRLVARIQPLPPTLCVPIALVVVILAPKNLPQTGVGLAVLAAVALVLLSLAHEDGDRFPLVKPLAWIGGLSYVIYLCHFPMFVLAQWCLGFSEQISTPSYFAYLAVATIASIAAALVTGRFIERPLQRFGISLSRQMLWPARLAQVAWGPVGEAEGGATPKSRYRA
jgi:peptidoglycan/LPS O-acetylase OafA/YrhL